MHDVIGLICCIHVASLGLFARHFLHVILYFVYKLLMGTDRYRLLASFQTAPSPVATG